MSDRDPYMPPEGGNYIPPPPPPPPPPAYPVTSDIPPQSSYHYSAAPTRQNRGALGWLGSAALALWAVLKYGGLLLFKIPALGSLFTILVSFGAYAVFYGPWFAVALITMLFVHEMGHVVEIRRQGMHASAPIFIPFIGAAIFQRQHATDALKQAQIGIGGPIAGTLGATAALVLYTATHNEVFLLAAWLGFFLNLLNLIPIWQLDGAWVLAPVSPWLQVAGFVMIGVAVIVFHFVSVFLIIIALAGIPTLIQRFRTANDPYYTSVPVQARWALGVAWLVLVGYLGFAMLQTSNLLASVPR